jgi:hyperosmotically inducible periplasmic protein
MKLTPIKLLGLTLISLLGLSACDNQSVVDAENKLDQAVESVETKIDGAAEQMSEASDVAGMQVEDATITTKIKTAFLAEPTLKSLDMSVSTTEGFVVITGVVDSLEASQKAAEIAEAVSEVKQVNNQLVVQ